MSRTMLCYHVTLCHAMCGRCKDSKHNVGFNYVLILSYKVKQPTIKIEIYILGYNMEPMNKLFTIDKNSIMKYFLTQIGLPVAHSC